MLVGGYPEYFEIKDIDVWQKLLAEDIITRALYKDILTIYIIIDRKIDLIPIEVKYINQIEQSDLKVISDFIEEHKNKEINKVKYGIIITKDILKKEGNLYFIPYRLVNL